MWYIGTDKIKNISSYIISIISSAGTRNLFTTHRETLSHDVSHGAATDETLVMLSVLWKSVS